MDGSTRAHRVSSRQGKVFPHRVLQATLAVGLAFTVAVAHAISLGEIEVRSHLGQALDARIPVRGADLGMLEDDCFAIVPPSRPGIPVLERGELKLERGAGGATLRVRSTAPVQEPALMLGIRAACPGQQGVLLREYPVLLDPVRIASAPPIAATAGIPSPIAKAGSPIAQALPTSVAMSGPRADSLRASRPHASKAKGKPLHHRSKRTGAHPAIRRDSTGRFVLKLSGPSMDLTPMRRLDEASRTKLRERLAVLDADDEVSAMLALHDQMRRLESQVAQLQLRISRLGAVGTPAFTAKDPSSPHGGATPVQASAKPPQRAVARLARAPWLVLAALLALAAAALAWALRRRTTQRDSIPLVERMRQGSALAQPMEREETRAPGATAPLAAPPAAPPATPVPPMHAQETQPPALDRAAMGDDDSVIRAARLYYEDGALLRAVQLLQAAVDRDPARTRAWLALLELLHREGLAVDYAELAERFHDVHGEGEAWRKVQFLGRELDSGAPLYFDDDPRPLAFDPLGESWLGMPASFDEALASELSRPHVRGARGLRFDAPSRAMG